MHAANHFLIIVVLFYFQNCLPLKRGPFLWRRDASLRRIVKKSNSSSSNNGCDASEPVEEKNVADLLKGSLWAPPLRGSWGGLIPENYDGSQLIFSRSVAGRESSEKRPVGKCEKLPAARIFFGQRRPTVNDC